MKKKIFALMMGTLLLLSTTVGAFAGNTSDTPINFDVSALNYSATTNSRAKYDTSAVYLHVTSLANNSSVNVRAMGVAGSSTQNLTENGTTGSLTDHVICIMKTQYSIHSQINEKGYGNACLAFQSKNTISSERVVGVWSPDSTRTYTHAWS